MGVPFFLTFTWATHFLPMCGESDRFDPALS